MTVEEAIQTAIQYEAEVRDVYRDAAARMTDPTGKRVCEVMGNEEQEHLDYLTARLVEWRDTGKIEAAALKSAVPSCDVIADAAANVSGGMSDVDRASEREMLTKALEAENKTSSFYRKMVADLPSEARPLFERFVEIEEGHVAMVQAEIDSLTGTGAWFDVLEVKL